MGAVLIVANQTIGGGALGDAVRERVAAGRTAFHLLVPVPPMPVSAIAVGLAAVESAATALVDLPDPRDIADERLATGLDWLRALGAEPTGEVGSGDAVAAVKDVVGRVAVDEVIVSTLPSRISRWLKHDLPTRIGKCVSVPITVVTARPD